MDSTVRQPAPSEPLRQDELRRFNLQVREALNACYVRTWWTTTTTATSTTIWTGQMPTNSLWMLDIRVEGFCASDGSAGVYERRYRLKRTTSTPVTIRSTTPVADDEDVAGWNIGLTADSSGGIYLSVTGDSLRTIDWLAWVAIQEAPRRITT